LENFYAQIGSPAKVRHTVYNPTSQFRIEDQTEPTEHTATEETPSEEESQQHDEEQHEEAQHESFSRQEHEVDQVTAAEVDEGSERG